LKVTCDAPLAATARRGRAASAARQGRLWRSGGWRPAWKIEQPLWRRAPRQGWGSPLWRVL